MERNFICRATGEPCSNPGCKIGFCIAEVEERRLAGQAEAQLAERIIAARKAKDAKAQEIATALIKEHGFAKAAALVDQIIKQREQGRGQAAA